MIYDQPGCREEAANHNETVTKPAGRGQDECTGPPMIEKRGEALPMAGLREEIIN